jgi:hypothetical protein
MVVNGEKRGAITSGAQSWKSKQSTISRAGPKILDSPPRRPFCHEKQRHRKEETTEITAKDTEPRWGDR